MDVENYGHLKNIFKILIEYMWWENGTAASMPMNRFPL